MNAQSLSLSQSFLMNFASGHHPMKNEGMKDNQQNIPQNRLVEDSYRPSSPKSTPVNTSMPKPEMSFVRSESINLQFTTKEGDVVTINFKRSESRGADTLNKEPVGNNDDDNKKLSYKTNSNLSLEKGLNKTKPSPPLNIQKNKVTDVANKANSQPINNPTHPTQQNVVKDVKVAATPVKNIAQQVKQKPNQSVELKETESNKNKVSENPRKVVASRRGDIQIEQGNNKLSASKEEKFVFESANKPTINADKKNTNPKPIKSPSPQQKQSPIIDKKPNTVNLSKSSQSPISVNSPEKQQNTTGEVLPVSASKGNNVIHMEQSFNKISADGNSHSLNSEFTLNIEGDLNKSERQSIEGLMQAMSHISHDFFQDGASHAFSQAQSMGFDTEQIAGFSMNENHQRSVQAVAAYQQTAMPEQDINTHVLSEASEFLSQAKESMTETKTAVESFEKPEQSFTDIFAEVGQLFSNGHETRQGNNEGDMFLKMIKNITADVFNSKPEALTH